MSPKEYSAYHRKQYQKWFRDTHNNNKNKVTDSGEAPVRKIKPRSEAEPMALTYCPFCGSRFYGCQGTNSEKEP